MSASTLLFTGCGEDFNPTGNGSGRIAPTADIDTEVLASVKQGRAEYSDVTAADLSLRLTSADGSYSKTWNSVAEFPLDEDFKVGEYTLDAFYGDENDCTGFEKPHYAGSVSLVVKENVTTPVALTASLANAMVSIDYTDSFKNYFTVYNTELASADGKYVYYSSGETRPGYITPGTVGITVNVTKPNGVKATYTPNGFEAAARNHYHLTLDVNDGNVGAAFLVVSFDDALNQEDVIIDLSEDLQNAPAPVVTTEGFTPGEALTVVSGMASGDPLKLSVVARGGLSSVIMTTASTSLIEQGWPEEIELLSAPANMQARLATLGFDGLGLWKNPDQMAVIDLTNVLDKIAYIEGNSNVTEFNFLVKDRYNKESEPVALTVNVEKLILELSNPAGAYEGEGTMDIEFAYNGIDVEKNVKFQYKNERGTWSDTTVDGVTAISRAAGNYRVTVSVPEDDNDITLRAVCGNTVSQSITVERTPLPFELAYSDNDVFATHALVTLTPKDGADAALASRATLYVSTDGTNYAKLNVAVAADGSCSLTGLTPATQLYVRIGKRSEPITFTTEAATQLPNSDMEQWTSTRHSSNCIEYFAEGWNTLNPLTISQRSGNYAYCATSGTKETSDAAEGSKAAVIRTVGWGSNNTAASGLSVVKHIDRGELSLGQWGPTISDDVLPEYGIGFASRPSSISFQYKYLKKGDYNGYAEITVYAADGSVLSSKSTEIMPQDNYTLMTLPLSYTAGAAKAAKISVIFRSSNVTSSLGSKSMFGSNNNLNYGSTSGGAEHVGSQLYIDDIQLNY